MGDHHDGLAEVVDRLAHEREDLGTGAGVEVAGGLVGEDDLGPAEQRAADRDPLLLPTRELGRTVREAVAEADGLHDGVEPGRVGLGAGQRHRQRHVLERVERRDQVVGLEDEPELVAPDERELLLAGVADLDVAQEDLARW